MKLNPSTLRFKAFLICAGLLIPLLFEPASAFATTTQLSPDNSQNQIILDSYNFQSPGISGGEAKFGTAFSYNGSYGFRYIPTASHYMCQVDILLNKNGGPTDGLQLKFYTGGTTLTNGTLFATSANVWLASDFSGYQWASFWFGTSLPPGNCQGVKAGTTYWLQVVRTGAQNDSKNYLIAVHTNYQAENIAWGDRTGSGTPDGVSMVMYGIADGSSLNTTNTQTCADNILYSACTLLNYLFIPNLSTTGLGTKIATLSATMNDKAPFAYFTALSSIDLSPPSTASAGWILPVNVGTGSASIHTSLTFAPSGGIADFFATVRTASSFIFWLGFLAYLYFLIRRVTTT